MPFQFSLAALDSHSLSFAIQIKDADRQTAPKSSTAFFRQLQEDVAASVDAVKREKTKAKDKDKRTTGSRLKL